jgi:lipoprotein-anchoring transpeptidase ErfK/SrfK
MPRALLLLLAFFCLASPALGGWRAQTSGDPAIDAQWARLGSQDAGAQVLFRPLAPEQPAPHSQKMDPAFVPAVVDDPTGERPGTIVIDTRSRYLYLVLDGGRAQRYGVGIGRDGFGWTGTVSVGRKAEWPTWTPPPEMRERQPYLPASMAGGPDNPLGARALYLYRGGSDTLFRIHGSNAPWTIGQAVSSGCFRMRNEDVIELYNRVPVGTKVVVI